MRISGWLAIQPDDLAKSRRWFNRHGTAVVFWGRLIPGVRTLVSVPAGIEHMSQAKFLAWTIAGSLICTTFWLGRVTGSGGRADSNSPQRAPLGEERHGGYCRYRLRQRRGACDRSRHLAGLIGALIATLPHRT